MIDFKNIIGKVEAMSEKITKTTRMTCPLCNSTDEYPVDIKISNLRIWDKNNIGEVIIQETGTTICTDCERSFEYIKRCTIDFACIPINPKELPHAINKEPSDEQ